MSSIPLSQIHLPKYALRDSYDNLTGLAKSIEKRGLYSAIILRSVGADRFEVVAGCRRFSAIKSLGRKVLSPTEYKVVEADDKTAFEISLLENVQRKTLTAQEEARAYALYCKEKGWGSVTDLSSKIHISPVTISHRIRLLGLPEGVLKKIGVLTNFTLGHAQELVALTTQEGHGPEALTKSSITPDKIVEIMDIIQTNRLSTDETRQVVQEIKSHPDASVSTAYYNATIDMANKPFIDQAVTYQQTQDDVRDEMEQQRRKIQTEEYFKSQRAENPVITALNRLEATAERYLTLIDYIIRPFQDDENNKDLYLDIVKAYRKPVHDAKGELLTIIKQYKKIAKSKQIAEARV
jgi:ParB/RepB/Spo0J family partition protein